jgi:hypothetical protein
VPTITLIANVNGYGPDGSGKSAPAVCVVEAKSLRWTALAIGDTVTGKLPNHIQSISLQIDGLSITQACHDET